MNESRLCIFQHRKMREEATAVREKVEEREGEMGMERAPMLLAHSHLREY
jgi:hypothetical protein